MRDLVFFAHRFPFPPDKGEKIRAWNLILHLAQRWRVHLGCLSDNPDDFAHLDTVRQTCADVAVFPIRPRTQKLRALARIRPGRPLMLDYYGNPGLHAWTARTLSAHPGAVAFAYSTPMAQYVLGTGHPTVLDMVDVDSEKFAAYAAEARFPMRLVWAREARTLLAFEQHAAQAADLALLVSQEECARFGAIAPALRGRVHPVQNGVDLAYFSPAHSFARPWPDAAPRIVFTGHMDYPPNTEAALWFAAEVMPLLRAHPAAPRFAIIGANPPAAIQALAGRDIEVTGRVPDIRPYLAHAAAAAAPLRIARGIQNKVLEAMAMARPVVASPQAFEGVAATLGRDLLMADGAPAMARALAEILDGAHPALPAAARAAMERHYAWSATLARLDELLDSRPALRDNPPKPARAEETAA